MNNALFEGQNGERTKKAVFGVIVLLGAYLGVLVLGGLIDTSFSTYNNLQTYGNSTIAVSGHGEVVAVPDVATFTFSVVSDKASVADAQADAATKANATESYLKNAGINEKDIQTSDYSISPQYEYQNLPCTPGSYCPGRQVLKGYQVRQTTTVKVRDTKKAGDVLAGVGSKGASEVSGLNFTFADTDAIRAQARDKAIVDAKAKAQVLAKQLGVSIVRISQFAEGAGDAVMPQAPYTTMAMGAKAAAPEISVGQNKVVGDVTITYEIK